MNRWHFSVSFDPAGRLEHDASVWFSDKHLRIDCENLHPMPRRHHAFGCDVFMFGNPIALQKRNDGAVLSALGDLQSVASAGVELNGSYLILIYRRDDAELTVINDRFAALALYHCQVDGVWHAASTLKLLRERGLGAGGIDETAAAEFLFLRRLLGEKTLQGDIRYLASASSLNVNRGGVREEKYWAPRYAGPQIANRELPGKIADALKACVTAHLSDGGMTGLLLSGGLDSRALLAASAKPLVCFTTCRRENNESAVAREVAEAAGARFHFVPRPAGLLDDALDDAVFLTGGQQIYSEAQFLGYANKWPEKVDTFFIGLGLDILLGGLYLPKEPQSILGRPGLHYRLKPLQSDLASMYLSGVSYRLKQSDPNLVVRDARIPQIRDMLTAAVNEIMDRGRALGAEGYDVWEFMHIHNLSRHYSFPMMMSLRSYADCRAPALDNRLFDLSIRMSAAQKVNGTGYQRALAKLAPSLMKIRNANTNLPAAMPLPQQTATKAVRFLSHKVFGTSYPVAPGARDRSWPSAKESLRSCDTIMSRVRALPRSDYLASVPFIDMDGVATVVEDFVADRRDHAVLLNVLLTLDGYLRPAA